MYLASMIWPTCDEPICLSMSKKRAVKEAVKRLKAEHGDGPVLRPQAMCCSKITSKDIRVEKLDVV